MKKLNIILVLPLVGTTLYAGLCTTGVHRHNPHCVAKPAASGTHQSGIVDSKGSTPDPSTTNPQTGSVTPDHHNAQIVVTGKPGPTISGYRPVVTATYGSHSGTSPGIVVTGTPGPTLTGVSKPPAMTATYGTGPSGTSGVVTGTYGPTLTGTGPVTVLKPTYGQGPSGYSPVTVVTGTYGKGPSGNAPVTVVTPHYTKGPSGYSPVTIVTPHYTKGPSGYSPVTVITPTYGPGPSGISGTSGGQPITTTSGTHGGRSPGTVVTGTYGPGPSGYSPGKITQTYMKGPSGYHPVTVVTPHYTKGPSGYSPATGLTPHYTKGPSGYSPVTVITPHYGKGPSGYSPVYTKGPSGYKPVYTKGPSGYRPVTAVTPTHPKGRPSNIPVVTTVTHAGATTTTGQIVPKSRPTHHFTTVNSNKPKPVTSGRHSLKEGYGFNIIEPGIQNREVAVYRSNDARQMRYKDTIEIDNTGGFLLIDHGTRDPAYVR